MRINKCRKKSLFLSLLAMSNILEYNSTTSNSNRAARRSYGNTSANIQGSSTISSSTKTPAPIQNVTPFSLLNNISFTLSGKVSTKNKNGSYTSESFCVIYENGENKISINLLGFLQTAMVKPVRNNTMTYFFWTCDSLQQRSPSKLEVDHFPVIKQWAVDKWNKEHERHDECHDEYLDMDISERKKEYTRITEVCESDRYQNSFVGKLLDNVECTGTNLSAGASVNTNVGQSGADVIAQAYKVGAKNEDEPNKHISWQFVKSNKNMEYGIKLIPNLSKLYGIDTVVNNGMSSTAVVVGMSHKLSKNQAVGIQVLAAPSRHSTPTFVKEDEFETESSCNFIYGIYYDSKPFKISIGATSSYENKKSDKTKPLIEKYMMSVNSTLVKFKNNEIGIKVNGTMSNLPKEEIEKKLNDWIAEVERCEKAFKDHPNSLETYIHYNKNFGTPSMKPCATEYINVSLTYTVTLKNGTEIKFTFSSPMILFFLKEVTKDTYSLNPFSDFMNSLKLSIEATKKFNSQKPLTSNKNEEAVALLTL